MLGIVVPKIFEHKCNTLELEMEKMGKKKAKINLSILVFLYTINFNPLYMYTKYVDWLSQELRNLAKLFIGKKENNGQI